MKNKFIVIIILASVYGCMPQNKLTYSAEKIDNELSRGLFSPKTWIVYKTYDECAEFWIKRADDQMWSEQDKNDFINSITPGGELKFGCSDENIEYAKTGNYSYVIKDNEGNELQRGDFNQGELDYLITSGGTVWSSNIYVDIKQKMPDEFTVYIINRVNSKKDIYRVKKQEFNTL